VKGAFTLIWHCGQGASSVSWRENVLFNLFLLKRRVVRGLEDLWRQPTRGS